MFEFWGHSKIIRFNLRQPSRKSFQYRRRRKDKAQFRFEPPGPFSICSYPPEDVVVENFGEFLKKKGTQISSEEGARTVPFSTSLEDGLDTRETVRHWPERKHRADENGSPVLFSPDYRQMLQRVRHRGRVRGIAVIQDGNSTDFY